MIADLAGWGPDDYEERERFVREARQLLLEEPASWAGALAYRPRHDWVRELMAERLGGSTSRAHHGTLSRKLATWPAPVDATARRYALRHALVHRVEAGEWADAWRLAADTSLLEAKCRELGVHEAEADMARAEVDRPQREVALATLAARRAHRRARQGPAAIAPPPPVLSAERPALAKLITDRAAASR